MRVRRRHERFVRRLETEFIGNGKTYRAISSDFSRYGLFIRTNHAFVPGTELEIIVHLPNGENAFMKGTVMRAMKTPIVSLKNGMGIELTKRDASYIKFLKEFDPTETEEPHRTYMPPPKAQQTPEQADEFLIIACPSCRVKNKIRKAKLGHGPKCGKCGSILSLQV